MTKNQAALEALDRLNDCLRGFYSECRSEMMDSDKQDIDTIKSALEDEGVVNVETVHRRLTESFDARWDNGGYEEMSTEFADTCIEALRAAGVLKDE